MASTPGTIGLLGRCQKILARIAVTHHHGFEKISQVIFMGRGILPALVLLDGEILRNRSQEAAIFIDASPIPTTGFL